MTPDPTCRPAWYSGPATLSWADTGNRNTFAVVDPDHDARADERRANLDRVEARALAAARDLARFRAAQEREGDYRR